MKPCKPGTFIFTAAGVQSWVIESKPIPLCCNVNSQFACPQIYISQTALKLAVSRTSETSPCSGKVSQLTQLRVSSTHVDWSFGSLYTPYRRLLPADRRTTAPKAPAPHSMTGLMFFYRTNFCIISFISVSQPFGPNLQMVWFQVEGNRFTTLSS